MSWLSSIDFSATLATCHQDILGDWYRDPWAWPELEYVADHGQALVEERLRGTGARQTCLLDVPKENFATRPAMILDPLDRFAYQSIVGRISVELVGNLDRTVFGWRLPLTNPQPGHYSANNIEWDQYRQHLNRLADVCPAALKTDIVSCFASIPSSAVSTELERRLEGPKHENLVTRLLSMLSRWERIPTRPGLPQRCQASSVLANMVLSPLDDVMLHYARDSPIFGVKGRTCARWMDDIWIFGDDAGPLRAAQVNLQAAVESLGLHMNGAKTKVLEGDDVVTEAKKMEHSAIDEGLFSDPVNTEPLEELVDRILNDREHANRTSIIFASRQMRSSEQFPRLDDVVDALHRMPHGADTLARLLRDAGRASSLQDWYLEYCKSPWAVVEWSVAQFGTMFSSTARPAKALIDLFAQRLASGRSTLPMTALAAQRLASWDPSLARVVIEGAIKHADNPLQRRVLAMAGLNAGHNRTKVQKWLGEFDENRVTLQMLQERSFAKIEFQPDFAAD